jgi:uncharacterized membrane protein
MNARLTNFLEKLRSTYWLIPGVMTLLSIGLSFAMVRLDLALLRQSAPFQGLGWIYTGGAEGARTLLSTVAGSMITVAGVVFSITIVALTLASQQFGPRILRNFMRDTGNQFVLGAFVSTYMYCLLVLRTIRGVDNDIFVPNLSVTLAVFLTAANLGVLIYFIHHAAASIQGEHIIARVGRDLEKAIERFFPDKPRIPGLEQALRSPEDLPAGFGRSTYTVLVERSGYVQAIEYAALLDIAARNDLIVSTNYRPGEFFAEGSCLAEVWPQARVDEGIAREVAGAFILGSQRVQTQDIEYHVNQLVEIAVRALSAAINDPFTAMSCLNRLAAALSLLAEKTTPPLYHYDEHGRLRLIADTVTFSGVVDTVFNLIRQHGIASVPVLVHSLEAITIIAAHTTHDQERAALLRHAHLIKESSDLAIRQVEDRREVERRYQIALKALEIQAAREPGPDRRQEPALSPE